MVTKKYVDPNNARNEPYRQVLLEYERKGIDPFTKETLAQDGIPILYETDHWFVFPNQHPYSGSEVHLVFVCKAYAEALWELSPEAQLDLNLLRKQICEDYHIPGGAFLGRFGNTKKTGATVTHYHEHLIVPKDGEVVPAYFGSKRNE